MLHQPQQAHQALGLGPSPLAPAALWGVTIAGRALGYCECETAAAVLDDSLPPFARKPRLAQLARRGGTTVQLRLPVAGLPLLRR